MIKGLWLVIDMGMKEVDVAHHKVMVDKVICLINSKLDINFVVGEVSSYIVGPQESHLEVVKHIFCYLERTIDFGISYCKWNSNVINGFSYFDRIDDFESGTSTSGFISRLGLGPIYWLSNHRSIVALT